MTIDDALKAWTAIEAQRDGSETRAVVVEALHRKLIENPGEFWEYFLTVTGAMVPSHYRETAERLLRSGAVDDQTTFGDIPAILARDAEHQQ